MDLPDVWDAKLAANLQGEKICDLPVSRDGSLEPRVGQIHIPAVLGPFPNQCTPMSFKMADQFTALQTEMVSTRTLRLGRRERSTGSSIRRIASFRFALASRMVAPCVSAPGTSSVQATHHLPSLTNVARKASLPRRIRIRKIVTRGRGCINPAHDGTAIYVDFKTPRNTKSLEGGGIQ